MGVHRPDVQQGLVSDALPLFFFLSPHPVPGVSSFFTE
jgi:hypothetical protein